MRALADLKHALEGKPMTDSTLTRRIEARRTQVQGLERLARDLRALEAAARRRTAGQGR